MAALAKKWQRGSHESGHQRRERRAARLRARRRERGRPDREIRGRTATLDLSDGTFGQLPEANSLRRADLHRPEGRSVRTRTARRCCAPSPRRCAGQRRTTTPTRTKTAARGFGNGAWTGAGQAAGSALDRVNYVLDWSNPLAATLDEVIKGILKQCGADDWFDWVTGDSELLEKTAQEWRDAARDLRDVVADLVAERKSVERVWRARPRRASARP
ncbi:hypothetical protein SRIMM317S_01588 [Streptomyces rimosus subsp. rimosus]